MVWPTFVDLSGSWWLSRVVKTPLKCVLVSSPKLTWNEGISWLFFFQEECFIFLSEGKQTCLWWFYERRCGRKTSVFLSFGDLVTIVVSQEMSKATWMAQIPNWTPFTSRANQCFIGWEKGVMGCTAASGKKSRIHKELPKKEKK